MTTLSNSEKLSILRNLGIMLGSGIPLAEAVESLLEDTKGNQRKVLLNLRADLQQGTQISESFASYPRVFDKVTLNLIKAAEEAGTLETTLKDLQEHIQKEIEFTDKVKFAMIYPGLIMALFAGVLLMILTVVVPRISGVFSRLRVELPLPTKVLIWASNLLLQNTALIIVGVVVVVGGALLLYRMRRQWVLALFFGLPGISGLVRQIDWTRFSRSLYQLLSSGLPITVALELAGDVVMDRRIAKLIARCREMVIAGKKVSDGLRMGKKIVPNMMIKLVEAGERTGTLDKSMQEISEHLDYEVGNSLKAATALLEPVLLVIVGISVGGMMLAIIAPIYGLIGQVGGR
ncbi:MAG: Type IV pilin [Candidatus Amesbacteria bacterium GW2011_GWA2_47_11b]|uniref:Type IV pilin n=3 Tax=Candidatus Amesiibacteriota TaxID=1752730 RepID=A0A0G1VJG0_9BACT|nr:MAG: Type IV pilin [Microgenomates group bacterium GW2011_GWC1_46_20]KKU58370.1 MAG: Type IV pilin [Candidatus Amesbacteria bacterium GW2011_GWA2_47_11b]KKU70190.1 MAG: Type IV pilin [Candidatus Amesbacteria bacterium GW2011_GWA1_47_20]